jgi:hypothetical protein
MGRFVSVCLATENKGTNNEKSVHALSEKIQVVDE